jgi:predicted transcriptional regulator of viral defense system
VIFQEFRKAFYELACFASPQVYAWRPGFDKNNLGRWVKQGLLVKLRNNYYCFPEYKAQAGFEMYVANRIYRPSYISLHSALSFYGLIPEAIVQVTSVSTLKTANFENPMGSFHYHSVRPDLMFGYDLKTTPSDRTIRIAEPEKALLDLLYLFPFYDTPDEMEDLRLDDSLMGEVLDIGKLKEYSTRYSNKALMSRCNMMIKSYAL